ncbi:hypothetical protein AWZ03_004495 [Drosophila navojoa]|uniref:Uncharacterized protein n=1 Tax=Drosophila navojoa TaxID=7232 RepID=A0A484BLU9_DRONA|nr:hypothetical protein AWZ03_004495 [Drosophila navojoa]
MRPPVGTLQARTHFDAMTNVDMLLPASPAATAAAAPPTICTTHIKIKIKEDDDFDFEFDYHFDFEFDFECEFELSS